MTDIKVQIQPIFIKDHPNADRLQIGNIGSHDGWQVIIQKGRFNTGDMCAYIGESAIVPEWLLKFYGYWNEDQNKGLLAGSKGDRVKGIRLRGEFSLGIVLPVIQSVQDPNLYSFPHLDSSVASNWFDSDTDFTDILEIKKHEPVIPASMGGEVYNVGQHIGVHYDLENIKNYPEAFNDNDWVRVEEKIHGSQCQVVILPFKDEYYHEEHLVVETDDGEKCYIAISSKGLGAKGLFLKHNEQNEHNLYIKTIRPLLQQLAYQVDHRNPVVVVGEVFGKGVQDLTYGQTSTSFRIFDVYIGKRGTGKWLNYEELVEWCNVAGISRVPTVYVGPFSKEKVIELTQHTKSVFDPTQIREGVVIKSIIEQQVSNLGRLVLKSINEDYLTRKNGTEFN
ncbi:MAG: RNA ligase (ATP) [Nitrososphaeraceae archaeon]